jgi:hypothetical protein
MKKIAFITHSFHKITKSADIYVEELLNNPEQFKVDIFYNYEWGPQDQFQKFDKKIENYDVVIILQLISVNLLKNIDCKNIIFIPMFDYSRNFSVEQWLPAASLKILTPVKALSKNLESIGLSSYYFKYYPEVGNYKLPNFNNIYFWNRVDEIDYRTVLKLLGDYKFSKLNIHKVTDPGNNPPLPSNNEINKFNITFTDWFETKSDYNKNLEKFGIYIAPKPFEGGGAAFTDALKSGHIVIAPNHAPFNEYIENKRNGFLYDIYNPQSIELEKYDLETISKSAFESTKRGRYEFLSSLKDIQEFILSEDVISDTRFYFENLETVFQNRWFRFGNLKRKDKLKVIFQFIYAKIKNIF